VLRKRLVHGFIVVPARWKGKARECRIDDPSGAMRSIQPVREEEFAPPRLGLQRRRAPRSARLDIVAQPFEHAHRAVEGTVGRTSVALAVPAAVGHLLLQQIGNKLLSPWIVEAEPRQQSQDHSGDAVLAAMLARRQIHPAVFPEALVEEQTA
jgi:hypothetical protein